MCVHVLLESQRQSMCLPPNSVWARLRGPAQLLVAHHLSHPEVSLSESEIGTTEGIFF